MPILADRISEAVAKATAPSLRVDFEKEPTIIHLHEECELHASQKIVWRLEEEKVAAIAGKQSGKTKIGPYWALREIQRKGGGAFLVIGPNFPVMNKQLIPEVRSVWEGRFKLGEYKQGDKKFEFSPEGLEKLGVRDAIVWFCFAENPNSLVSVTACGAWLDEPGHPDFSREANEEIDARLSVRKGRRLYTTSPYSFNWLKTDVYDTALHRYYMEGGIEKSETRENGDPKIAVVSYRSKDNPSFDDEKWWELKEASGNNWKFRMSFGGEFTRPSGTVYENFDSTVGPGGPGIVPTTNVCKRFQIPAKWKRYAGHDFGPVHTAGAWVAEDPATGVMYGYHDYLDGNKSVEAHVASFRLMAGNPERAWGGSWSEDTYRSDYALRDYRIYRPPIKDLYEGIDRLHSLFTTRKIVLFSDLPSVVDFLDYAWQLGPNETIHYSPTGNPVIAAKESFHRPDAWRYLGTALYQGVGGNIQSRDAYWFGDPQRPQDIKEIEEGEADPTDAWCTFRKGVWE